jgi:hypothetical protein
MSIRSRSIPEVIERGLLGRLPPVGYANDIRAEMEFRAHSQSYLKITAGNI